MRVFREIRKGNEDIIGYMDFTTTEKAHTEYTQQQMEFAISEACRAFRENLPRKLNENL